MPFAALPSSPGFQQPPVPDWGRFAELAIQGIQHGGDIRAQAGKDFAAQVEKSFEQVSKIMQFNSPEAKAERRMKMMQTQAMTEVWQDYALHKDKYQMTAHGPVLKDPLAMSMKWSQYNNSLKTGRTLDYNLQGKQRTDADRAVDEALRAKAAYDHKRIGGSTDNTDASARTELVPAGDTDTSPGTGTTAPLPVPADSGAPNTNLNGEVIYDVNGNPVITE